MSLKITIGFRPKYKISHQVNKLALPYLMYLARTQPDISTQAMVSVKYMHLYWVPIFMDLCFVPGPVLWTCILVGISCIQVKLCVMRRRMRRRAIRHQSGHHRLCNLLTLRDWRHKDKLTTRMVIVLLCLFVVFHCVSLAWPLSSGFVAFAFYCNSFTL